MNYNWFKICNTEEFEALEIPSKNYEVILEGIGLRDVLVTKANFISITYDGVLLCPTLGGQNPFPFDGYAAFLDVNDDLWLGIEIEE